jgi:hypothetical protein
MFVTKRSLSRRLFLQGVGTTLALPFLESMVPALTPLARAQSRPRLRFGAVYMPNGTPMASPLNYWMPESGRPDLDVRPILQPLAAFKDQMTVVGNLSRAGGKTVTDHAVSSAGWLSGAVAKQTEAEDIQLGVTIDQVLAREVGHETPFPSLELATEDFSGYVGGCVPGYSCTYMNTISWADEVSPLPMEINPRIAFEKMFGRAGTVEQRAARMREDRSILDSIAGEVRQLEQRVGPADRARLGEYLTDVREIEQRIQRTEAANRTTVTPIDAPVGVPATFEEHAALMFDLLAVAYQSDLTRVFTFMMGREASQRTYPELGLSKTHHDTSHHGNQPDNMAEHAKIDIYYATLFSAFVDKLRRSPDGDGNVLDHSLLVFGAGMSDGQAHSPYPLPIALVGGAGGRLRGDRFLEAPEWTSVANLWLSVADVFGSRLEQFGESTGRVEL